MTCNGVRNYNSSSITCMERRRVVVQRDHPRNEVRESLSAFQGRRQSGGGKPVCFGIVEFCTVFRPKCKHQRNQAGAEV